MIPWRGPYRLKCWAPITMQNQNQDIPCPSVPSVSKAPMMSVPLSVPSAPVRTMGTTKAANERLTQSLRWCAWPCSFHVDVHSKTTSFLTTGRLWGHLRDVQDLVLRERNSVTKRRINWHAFTDVHIWFTKLVSAYFDRASCISRSWANSHRIHGRHIFST